MSESTKKNVATRESTMKDGCEYVSGIENTREKSLAILHFCKFQLFIFFLLRYGREFVYCSKNREKSSQIEIEEN